MIAGIVATACSKTDDRIALRLQAFGDGEEIAAYQQLIDGFEAANPGISVELTAVPKQGDHMAKLSASFATGAQPEVWLANFRRFGQLARNGAVDPAQSLFDDGTLKRDDFYPIALEAFTVDGKVMCAPQNVSSPVIYINTKVFADAGVTPPFDGWTWEEFVAVGKKLTTDTDGDGKTDIYGFATEPDLVRLAPFVWQAGGQVVDDTTNPTRTTLLGDGAIDGMSFFLDLQRKHKLSPTQAEVEAEGLEDRFASGRLAMLMDSRRITAQLRAVEGLDFDVLPLPTGKEAATVLHSDAYCISSGIERTAEARTFVAYALSVEGASILARTGRTVPSLRAVAESEAYLVPGAEPAHAQVWLDAIGLMRLLPNIAAWNEIESKATPIVEEWYYGLEPPEALGIEIDLATRGLFAPSGGP